MVLSGAACGCFVVRCGEAKLGKARARGKLCHSDALQDLHE